MAMSRRLFRTNQAIESFEKCLQCDSLPKNKEEEVQKELTKSKNRLQQQKDDVSMVNVRVSVRSISDSMENLVCMNQLTPAFQYYHFTV